MKIKIKKINSRAIIPTKGSVAAAGYDLYASLDAPVTIPPHTTEKIPTDLSFELPDGYFAGIYARSGLATKQGLRPANCVGICDSDYRGNYIVPLHNDTESDQIVNPGERIAQVIFQPYLVAEFEEVKELTTTDRGDGGFGSTGL